MYKQMFVYAAGKPLLVTLRNYTKADIEGMIAIQKESFPPPFPPELWWNEAQLREHAQRFPEGALCAEVDGQLIGSMTALLVGHEAVSSTHSWEQITDSGYIRNHNPEGDTLYVVDLCVIPAYRQYGIGKWLMLTMYEVVVHLHLTRLLGGGRMPGYKRYADQLTAQEYLERIISGELKDPVLSFLLRCGRMPVGVAEHYLEDEDSCDYAALMEWRNPFIGQQTI
ncbi:GNAT family N-acetyltransferase [Paenibacillus mendelii]|uniref:GNAT family N-acetyltransferase n=1 Tax=Paenibacillus mendelii TaxID=206163 RepID=A0ABV6J5I1_9BACL|nr:GNAT family N-acetyltransferase [Paenibacillus mendelii]MCQ6560149.1 GNAT family N-acetyltransferase [Paenibacillus mendelii]